MRQLRRRKKQVTKVIDTLTQGDFQGAFQKLLERYNKRIGTGGDYFEGDLRFMCVLSIKVPIGKKSGNLFNDLQELTLNNQRELIYHTTQHTNQP